MTWLEFADAIKEGEKIRIADWDKEEYIYLCNEKWIDSSGNKANQNLSANVEDLELYIEPNPKNTYTLYEKLRVYENGEQVEITWDNSSIKVEHMNYTDHPTGEVRVIEIEE